MHPQLIEHIRTHVDVNESELETLFSYLKLMYVAKKQHLLKEHEICRNMYFVENGCLRMYFINEKGTEQITQFAIENWWIADYMSFDRQSPSQFYIQAIENSEVFFVEHHTLEQLLNELPQLEKYFRLMLQKAYAASQLRVKYLYSLSKEESYQQFITGFPGFTQRIPQYMLASYLNFTPEYLSELRKKIRE